MQTFALFSMHYWRHMLWRYRTRQMRARQKQPVRTNGIWFRKYWQSPQLKAPLRRRLR